ncbi:MAG: hypothetical protein QHH07_11715 [Sedimentisphaerales bacterium]|nr:hypothetical protein [Sedimentisphaerales bacterium]
MPIATYPQATPLVIWFHAVKTNPIGSLQTALSSGIPNHVMIWYMHRLDADWQASPDARKAIELVRQAQVRLIWCRSLWPYYKDRHMGIKTLTDPQYYVEQIRMLQAEGQAMKADYVALDLEPSGASPLKGLFKGPGAFTPQELKAIASAVQRAIGQAGQVDFVIPAGSTQRSHPYNVLCNLGRMRICKDTYYGDAISRRPPYEYHIFGANVSCRKWRFVQTRNQYYTIQDLFDKSQIWSDRQGLLIYAAGPDSTKVAQDLKDYSKGLVARAYGHR